MTAGKAAAPGRKAQAACLASGFLALGLVPMQAIAVPLWALELGASPGAIGLSVGLRSLGPLLFAIHGGALMDRLGAKNVMTRMAAVCVVMCLAYPFLPFVSALMLLQFVFGLAQGLAWVGAQTLIGQWTRGDPAFAGRLSAAAIMGTFAGPIVAGIAWDWGGALAAFLAMALWSLALLGAALALPRRRPRGSVPGTRRLRDLAPNPDDYRAALGLLAIPVMAALMAGSVARLGIVSVQGSFYPVYLDEIGIDAGTIGLLVGAAALVGAPGALLAARLGRIVPTMASLVALTIVAVLAMTATPLTTSVTVLAALAILYGLVIGVTQAQVLSLLGRHAPSGSEGLAVGLRTTFNRAGSFLAPVVTGTLAEAFGLTAGFFATGALLLAAALVMAILARRAGV